MTARAVAITRGTLHRWPLPSPPSDGDKDDRGTALIVGGSTSVAGAVVLAAIAALRAGAGKLQIATAAPLRESLGVAIPEAMVIALASGKSGELNGASSARALRPYATDASAMLVGPGMQSRSAAHSIVKRIVPALRDASLVVDAAAIESLHADPECLEPLAGRAILTPHAGEMAALLDMQREEVEAKARDCAVRAAERFGAIVALKGATTWIASPDGALLRHDAHNIGLATSGSGDVLAGVVAGLLARGAAPLAAIAWGVYAHARAGSILSARISPTGFLARELLAEIPRALRGRRR